MRFPPFPPSLPSPPPPSAFPRSKNVLSAAHLQRSAPFPHVAEDSCAQGHHPKAGRIFVHAIVRCPITPPPPPIVCPPISPPRSSSASQHSSPPPHSIRQLLAHLCSPVLFLVRPDHPLRSLNSAIGVEHGADDAYGRQRCPRSPPSSSLLVAMSRRFSSIRYNSNRLYWHTMDKAEI
jgi:hypothetical protein